MAEMVLSPLVGMVIETLMSELTDKAQMIWQAGDDLNTLSKMLQKIQCVIADAEEVQITKKTVKHWLSELKDIAYDADDVLDELQYEAFRQLAEGDQTNEGKGKRVRDFFAFSFFSRPNSISFRLAQRIKIINERLATVSRDTNYFGFREDDGIRMVIKHDTERPPTSSVPIENEFEFLGRERDKGEIIKRLLSNDDQTCRRGQAYSVISIVGMGGLGKTTLAQHVYNDKYVEKHFEIRAWVCVSEEFDVIRLTREITESATKKKCDSLAIDLMQCNLKEILTAKRFLIVLDDIWNDECKPWKNTWEGLRGPFNAGARGSKILVTTRDEQVSRTMSRNHPYLMKPLADEDCLSLFLRHAFADDEGSNAEQQELTGIGKELVEKHCQGLPLATKVLGGLLYGRKELNFWKSILNSQIWISGDNENEVMKALRVSYHHLPPHIKQCFAFCSIFPKDYAFKKDELVRLWMAQSFILPTKSMADSMLLEERGSQYFDLLLQRSFFQRNDECTFSVAYKMHDCMHDLALSVSRDECLLMERAATNPTPNDRLRHLSLLEAHTDKRGVNLGAFNQCKRLRTIRIMWMQMCQQAINDLIVNFKCLRVLILIGLRIEELPDAISNLKHLRYLDLSSAVHITQLPESVSSLYNLQTLKLESCLNLSSLPRETRKLINLRHLNFEKSLKLTSMPSGMGKLSSLQTLPRFVVGKESGNKIGELKGLAQLRGHISIEKLQNVSNAEEAKEARLKDKAHIQELELEWDEREEEGFQMNPQEEAPLEKELGEILEALQPHINLETLYISGYKGNIYPTWLQGLELPNLKDFTLQNCRNCMSLPPLGQFQKLERVCIVNMEGVKCIGHEFYGDRGEIKRSFPLLEDLEIAFMPNLEEWCEFEEGGCVFSHLQKLFIIHCPKLTKMPNYVSTVRDMLLGETCFPTWPSLDELSLWNSNEMLLRYWVPHLTSLSHLTIGKFNELRSLPRGMLHPLSNLKFLRIRLCKKLEALLDDEDEGLPSALVSLEINGCPSLKSLGHKCLPTTLQRLVIEDCSQLKKGKEDGEDWAKISHIPYIKIGGEIISE